MSNPINHWDEVDWSVIPDSSNTLKVVIFAEADRDVISFKDGLPYNDPTTTKFPTQAGDFVNDNPIINEQAVEYFVVVGSGNTQIKTAFNQVKNAKDQNGNPFVVEGTELIVMGHASPGTARTSMSDDGSPSGGVYGGVTPGGWKTIMQDVGLYDKFKTVNYGSCQMGESNACVNLSYAFGTDTKVIAQTDMRWGQGSSPAALYGDDWSKTKLYKNPALKGGTVAEALHSVGTGQVEITGYDRKQIRYNIGKAPFKLDGDQQFEDIGFGTVRANQKEYDEYEAIHSELMEESPVFASQRENIPKVMDEPQLTSVDPWTGGVETANTATTNKSHHKAKAHVYMQKQWWDEKYGEYNEAGELIGHTRTLPETIPDYYGRTGADQYRFTDEQTEEFKNWVDDKDKKTSLIRVFSELVEDEEAEWIEREDGTIAIKISDHMLAENEMTREEFQSEILDRSGSGNYGTGGPGWTINDDNTIDITGIDIPYEMDFEGKNYPIMMGNRFHNASDDPETYQDMNNYQDWLTKSRHGGKMNQLRAFQYGTEWDMYREQQSLQDRYMTQFGKEVESYMETDQGLTRPVAEWESGMLLDSDDMIPTTEELLKNPGIETDMVVNSMQGEDDLQLDERLKAIWTQYENRNPAALEAFNVASETLEELGVEPNTPYWDKLIELEALRLYAASDE